MGPAAQVDIATFTQWVDAYARAETTLADFYFKRFREEFQPAVNAWLATRPLRNAEAPLTPFAMPEYRLAARTEAEQLDARGEVLAADVRRDIQRSTNYVLGVVLFAVSLFFAGVSTRVSAASARTALVILGWIVFAGAAVWVATSPVSISV